jgi:cytochrome b6-f complex iron-sulfur subunit
MTQLDSAEGEAEPGELAVTRRTVLCSGAAVVGGAGLLVAVPVLRYLSPPERAESAREVRIPADRLAVWEAERIVLRGRPGYVVRTPDAVHALSATCTHLGCVVQWQRGRRQFFCPCHGGRFGPDGRILGGPLPAPLRTYEVDVREGEILVRST